MTSTAPPLRVGRARAPWVVAALTLLGLAGAGAYYVVHPAALPLSGTERTARTPVGVPVYLGVLRTDRTVHVTGVRMAVESSVPVEVRLLRCAGGEVQVTSDPSLFCERLEDPSGVDLTPADTLVAEVVAQEPGAAYLRPPRVSFVDGVQRGTTVAGSPAVVTVIER